MILLAAKALLAPALLAACTFVAWKWGSAAGGWLLGLPLISGPVSVILLLEHGPQFAENALFRVGHALERALAFDVVPERLR